MAADDDIFGLVIRKLESLARLDDVDKQALRALGLRLRIAPANHLLVREGDRPADCCMLHSGYACRYKTTSHGGRQIVSFHLPGDILDVQHLLLSRADHNLQTITRATVAWVAADELRQLASDRPRIGEALWRDSLIDASIFREWVLNIGRRDSKARIAHMLCEFAFRREAAGLGPPERFELPMTQEQIADATGMTSVHVNRMLQALRDEGVIARVKRDLEIVDWPRMQAIADFNPNYLHAAA